MKQYRNHYFEGQKIGHLVFVKRVESVVKGESPKAIFLCECGKEFTTRIDAAKKGKTKSCGCKSNELRIAERPESGIKKIPQLIQSVIDRFNGKIKYTANTNDCWEWQAGTSVGYGHFNIDRVDYIATRIAYYFHYKKDPLELCVLHKCDNPKCCNPHHLFLGTKNENMKDMAAKGRSNKGIAVNTNKLTEEQVRDIRMFYSKGVATKNELSKMYGVYHSTIISIVNNETWKHI